MEGYLEDVGFVASIKRQQQQLPGHWRNIRNSLHHLQQRRCDGGAIVGAFVVDDKVGRWTKYSRFAVPQLVPGYRKRGHPATAPVCCASGAKTHNANLHG